MAHWRDKLRERELLTESTVGPEGLDGTTERPSGFARPLVATLVRREERDHARSDLAPGWSPTLERKNTESIAYRLVEERHGSRPVIGSSA